MCFLRRGIKNVDSALSNTLFEIGELKRALPMQERDFCNDLGLRVQSDSILLGMVSIQAWDRGNPANMFFQAKGDPSDPDSWLVHKYQPGEWESLIGPTLELTRWIIGASPLQDSDLISIQAAVNRFRENGVLKFSGQDQPPY